MARLRPFFDPGLRSIFLVQVYESLAPSKPRVGSIDQGDNETTSSNCKSVMSISSWLSRMLGGDNERPDARPLRRMSCKVVAKVLASKIEVTADILM